VLAGQLPALALAVVKSALQRSEIDGPVDRQDELAIYNDMLAERSKLIDDLREVPGQ
jgi:hypothetical protein